MVLVGQATKFAYTVQALNMRQQDVCKETEGMWDRMLNKTDFYSYWIVSYGRIVQESS